jgi:hypothetical protein
MLGTDVQPVDEGACDNVLQLRLPDAYARIASLKTPLFGDTFANFSAEWQVNIVGDIADFVSTAGVPEYAIQATTLDEVIVTNISTNGSLNVRDSIIVMAFRRLNATQQNSHIAIRFRVSSGSTSGDGTATPTPGSYYEVRLLPTCYVELYRFENGELDRLQTSSLQGNSCGNSTSTETQEGLLKVEFINNRLTVGVGANTNLFTTNELPNLVGSDSGQVQIVASNTTLFLRMVAAVGE